MITIEDLHVRFNSDKGVVHAVRGVSLIVAAGEFYTLLGPSGCGKTTTLRCLAGLEHPSEGRILVGDNVVHDSASATSLATHRRPLSMVFQSYAIWPHLTVFENVAFPLRELRPRITESEIDTRVKKALEIIQLSGYESRPAPFLSGGQQQRLALARAIVRETPVVLFDEPLSNLDAKLRAETRLELRNLVKRLGMTALYVTHDQTEALTMSDRVAVMRDGEIIQEASPVEIYQKPNSRFVASFIGQCNFAKCTVQCPSVDGETGIVDCEWGPLAYLDDGSQQAGETATIAVRPENVRIAQHSKNEVSALGGTVSEIVFLGESIECKVDLGSSHIVARLHPSQAVSVGDKVGVVIAARDVSIVAP